MFDIHSVTGFGKFLGKRETIEEAEKFARWHAARRGIRVEITRMVPGKPGTTFPETVACVSRDALGRIWTDVMHYQDVLL